MRLLTAFTLLTICLIAIVLTFPTKKDKRQKTLTNYHPLTNYPSTYVDTESKYTDSTGIVVIIQNSIPRGEGYTDSAGKTFEVRIFWTRVINETDTPLELTINFPAEILRSTDSYLKVFLPQDAMTLDKETLWSYGITGLKSFLDTGFNKPSRLQRTI